MRTIKLRAWDRKLNIMWEPIELKKLLSYLIFQHMPNAAAYTEIKDHFNDIEWLEYTGLKDKNGKEDYHYFRASPLRLFAYFPLPKHQSRYQIRHHLSPSLPPLFSFLAVDASDRSGSCLESLLGNRISAVDTFPVVRNGNG